MQALVYTPAMQGEGAFDGGKLVEQKPIGFPGEGSVVKRVGPLFYWAWGTASEEARIGLHPHKGFEIMTYVVDGTAFHGDTLGTNSTIGAGGVQFMQTGSGVSHQERLSADAEMFQIWFEPNFNEAIRRQPTYSQYEHEQFPFAQSPQGYTAKTIIGDGSPLELVADIGMWDVEISSGASYKHLVPEGYSLTALAIRGGGVWSESGSEKAGETFRHRDFIVAAAREDTEAVIENSGGEKLRLILIQAPTTVDYPLYPKR
ncbi:pirin family protein [Paenibacillus sp. HB172176]|uniref:pirin family protein n=1 Tax=Paenibacillus sp. HB172176 TaxID=2493690 RepID=UPI00143A3254|nr:pirin family protein [Paenibacillus sp. HB172176]